MKVYEKVEREKRLEETDSNVECGRYEQPKDIQKRRSIKAGPGTG